MADRAFMYCPFCRQLGSPTVELMRDNVDFFCAMQHRGPHASILAMQPDMIKAEAYFKPGPHDMKVEVWVNQEVYQKAMQALGQRFHPTMASLIRCCMAGEPIVIDGQQAAELRKLGVRTGADMVVTAKLNLELSGQNESYVKTINEWEDRFSRAMNT